MSQTVTSPYSNQDGQGRKRGSSLFRVRRPLRLVHGGWAHDEWGGAGPGSAEPTPSSGETPPLPTDPPAVPHKEISPPPLTFNPKHLRLWGVDTCVSWGRQVQSEPWPLRPPSPPAARLLPVPLSASPKHLPALLPAPLASSPSLSGVPVHGHPQQLPRTGQDCGRPRGWLRAAPSRLLRS